MLLSAGYDDQCYDKYARNDQRGESPSAAFYQFLFEPVGVAAELANCVKYQMSFSVHCSSPNVL